MNDLRKRTCTNCGKVFWATYANEQRKFCSQSCSALFYKVGSTMRIPDGQPMSKTTDYRRRKSRGETQALFRYPFNEDFFLRWSSELAWLLGLIWSDGCLFKNSVEICSKDYDLLEIVETLIEMPHGIRPKNNGRHWRIVFSSPRVAQFLREIGLTEAKSFTANFPPIPQRFIAPFVRGLLDGDGSVIERDTRPGQQTVDITVHWYGASPFLKDGLVNWLDEHGIKSTELKNGTVWRINVVEQASLRMLHNLIYPNEDVCCLMRKRVPYEVWMSTPRVRSGRPRV